MTKREKVDYAFKNGDEIVFEVEDTIYVCFGGVETRENEIQFKDCSVASVNDEDEYFGDVENGSCDVYLRVKNDNDNIIFTKFYKEDLNMIINL